GYLFPMVQNRLDITVHQFQGFPWRYLHQISPVKLQVEIGRPETRRVETRKETAKEGTLVFLQAFAIILCLGILDFSFPVAHGKQQKRRGKIQRCLPFCKDFLASNQNGVSLLLLIFFPFVFCLLTDICCHAKQVFLCKRTCPVCVSPSSLLRTQMSSVIKNPVNF
ncbi:hypothetical protein STEG23_000751, partial [Scotinomys teguina]